MLQIRFSNRFERLQEALLDTLATPPGSPFTREEVIVPSAAIRRRVELAAADRFGICSNLRFSFLAQWLWRQIGHVVPDVAEVSPFTAPVLTWRVLAILAEPAFIAAHPPLARYLARGDAVMRFDLAARIATLLEQYLTYRPEWLAAWLAGKPAPVEALEPARAADERWQAAIWRRIAADLGTDARHPSVAFFEAMDALGPDAPKQAGLPERAAVFCLPAIPPLYLGILQRLARWIEVTLYVVNPCREYWLEAVPAPRLAWLAARDRADHHESGNRLLATWGRQAQAEIDLLLAVDGAIDDADFVEGAGTTLLGALQNAILDFTDPAPGSVALATDDRSIEVHVCHSRTRELEVLQDQLLALFAGPNPPHPSEIAVVLPDLEAAAPLIDAVFGNAPPARAIPYAITGRPASARNPVAQALLTVLAVATSRFTASAVFELLLQPVIARRFGIGETELAAIHAWIRAAGIRWGIDGRHRGELGLPPVGRHSFGDGLDRLFLGYALPATADAPLNDRLPAGNAEGSEALALGCFHDFVRALEHLHADLGKSLPPAAWRDLLIGTLDAFTVPVGDEIDDAREVLAGIHELHAGMVHGGEEQALPIDVVRAALQGLLDDPARGGVPTGAVTFSAIASLRQLPYRFVCVLGLDDGAFPSTQHPAEFDLIAHRYVRGDRQRRDDDRNVFLDLLLAARERLYLSYTGRSVRDNSPIPPSVLVAELLDYAAALIADPAEPVTSKALAAARQRLVVLHPLQPFSIDYFTPGTPARARSFNDEYCAALQARLAVTPASPAAPASIAPPSPASPAADGSNGDGQDDDGDVKEPQHPFFAAALPSPGPEFREVTLEGLLRFFRNPCRYLLKERLGIVLPEGDEELQDDEPFVVDWKARDALAQRLLPQLLAGGAAGIGRTAAAGTEYPPGRLGAIELEQELTQLTQFAAGLAPLLQAPPLDPCSGAIDFDLEGEPWRLVAGFGDIYPTGRIRYRYDDVRPGDYLTGWIEHLALNALAPEGAVPETLWLSRDGRYRLPPIDGARGHLAGLLKLYRQGLSRPLHFFPKSAWTYVLKGEDMRAATARWESSRFNEWGEDRDPAYRLALRGVDDPLDDQFAACAATVFAPLLAHIDDERLA